MKTIVVLALLALIGFNAAPARAEADAGLKLTTAELDRTLPAAMKAAHIPGLSIALIENGKLTFSRAYGVQDEITLTPMTTRTVFQAASLGKVVGAYTALRMVDAGQLSLDQPLSEHLAHRWSPDPAVQAVTLREVLSHSAGFSNQLWPLDRMTHSAPGARFSYSGVGFVYLQTAIEAVTRKPIDVVARRLTFQPLGMGSASFDGSIAPGGRMALGHVPLRLLTQLFIIPASVLWALFLIVALIVSRFAKRSVGLRTLAAAGVVATAGAASIHAFGLAPGYLVSMLTVWTAVVLFGAAIYALGSWALSGARALKASVRRKLLLVIAALGTATALIVGSGLYVPLAPARPTGGSLPFSLCVTAEDLAKLAAEIDKPTFLKSATAKAMLSPQVYINPNLSWGLGVGLYNAKIVSFSQWGSNPGYEGLMVGVPSQDRALVILSNSSGGLPLLRRTAQTLLGMDTAWSISPPKPLGHR